MKFIKPENISSQKIRELAEQLEEKDVKYGPWTLSFESMFAELTDKELKLISDASEKIIRASEIFTNIVLESEELREEFNWPEAFWKLVAAEPGYSRNIPCSRFDAFLNEIPLIRHGELSAPIVKGELPDPRPLPPESLKFIELNTDGCSGMTNADIFQESYSEIFGLSEYKYEKVVPHLIETLLECYKEFRGNFPESGFPEKPVVGILDWAGEETFREFEEMVRSLSEAGVESHIITPEKVEYDGSGLFIDGEKIHLIYRRLLGAEYAENLNKLHHISSAFLERKVCMAGAPRSQIAFSKKLFAFLQSSEIQNRLPGEIVEAVDKHLPWTRIFKPSKTSFRDKEIDLIPFVRENKDFFVLKPCESKCGVGIYQGKFTEQVTWKKAVDEAAGKDFIIQEFIDLPEADFAREGSKKKKELRYIHLGAYVFGGKFSGFLGRTCSNPLLTVRHGERLLFVGEEC